MSIRLSNSLVNNFDKFKVIWTNITYEKWNVFLEPNKSLMPSSETEGKKVIDPSLSYSWRTITSDGEGPG